MVAKNTVHIRKDGKVFIDGNEVTVPEHGLRVINADKPHALTAVELTIYPDQVFIDGPTRELPEEESKGEWITDWDGKKVFVRDRIKVRTDDTYEGLDNLLSRPSLGRFEGGKL